MTVSSSTNRVSYSGNGTLTVFAYTFKVFDEDDLTVILRASDGTETVQTITTHYTVSGVGDAGGGNVTFVTAPTATETVVILREQPLTQGLDLVPNDPFPAQSLEETLDKLTFVDQRLNERADRTLTFSAGDVVTDATLPVKELRVGKVLAFNETTGNPEAGPTIADTQTLANISADIGLLADIEDGTIATNAITIASANITDIVLNAQYIDAISGVYSISTAVSQVNSALPHITTIAPYVSDISDVAGSITNVNALGATSVINNMATLAPEVADINSLAYVEDGTLATNGLSNLANNLSPLLAVNSNLSNINNVASINSDVTTVSGISANVTTVAGQTTNLQNVTDNLTAIQNASTNASNAAASASAAAASAAAAAASADTFDDTYLGSKASDPATDNDGDALTAGDLYFNTTDNKLKVYSGSAWQTAALDSSGFVETTGDTLTGNLNFGDNDKAIFGAGSDLQIYHSGAASFISEAGTGNLFIEGSSEINFRNTAQTAYLMRLTDGGNVRLYHAGAQKLATTSTGIDVTGTVTAGGLTLDNGASTSATIGRSSNADDSSSLFLKKGYNGSTKLDFVSSSSDNSIFRINVDNQENVSFDWDYDSAITNDKNISFTSDATKTHLNISTTGDISFYEDTGTTAKFFWDASAESLGIGTTSPSELISVEGVVGANADAPYIALSAGRPTDRYSAIGLNRGGTSNQVGLSFYTTNNLDTPTEKMRIDSSGNLLVGTTTADQANNSTVANAGIALRPSGSGALQVSRDGGQAATFNRLTSDGDIAVFRKDGTTVGSIATKAGELYLGSANTGVRFYDTGDAITPFDVTGATGRDAAIDIGVSSTRFKDLYLSGGVYLGGTGAANKLDDYEEGTFTPEVADAGSGGNAAAGYDNRYGYYTKIGRLVTVNVQVINIDTTGLTGTNDVYVRGLPFTSSSSSGAGNYGTARLEQINVATACYNVVAHMGTNQTAVRLNEQLDAANDDFIVCSKLTSGTADIIFTLTYMT